MEPRTAKTESIKTLIGQALPSLTTESTPRISEIELTPEELSEAIHQGKLAKQTRIFQENYEKRMREEVIYPTYTTAEFMDLKVQQACAILESEFIMDRYNTEIFELLCQYFNNDPAFEQNGRSLKKGVMLYGNLGCGKTFLMRLFQINPKCTYRTFHCKMDVERRYRDSGESGIEPMYRMLMNTNYINEFGHKECATCFDDMGTEEPEVNFFGNKVNLMRGIIEGRYSSVVNSATHYTTNLTADDIGNRYGLRVRDRFREMVNLIKFDVNAPSRRK